MNFNYTYIKKMLCIKRTQKFTLEGKNIIQCTLLAFINIYISKHKL